MTLRRNSPRARRRWLGLGIATSAMMLLIAGAVLAVHDEDFQLDGNIATSPDTNVGGTTQEIDWQDLFDANGNELALPANFDASGFDRDFVTNTNGSFNTSDNTTFATGSKDTLPITPGWQCNVDNNVLSKNDIMNSYAASYEDPGSGDEILYFALERNANTGTANVAFWFLQDENVNCTSPGGSTAFTGDHVDGDLLAVAEFTQGGVVNTIQVYRWTDDGVNPAFLDPDPVAAGVDCGSTAGGDTACGNVNEGTLTGIPWLTSNKQDGPGHSLRVSEFFEGGINLTKSNLGGRCFNVFMADTRSSTSLTATLFDFSRGRLGDCTSTTTTTPKYNDGTTDLITEPIPATGQLLVKDSALIEVNGADTFDADVTFYLCESSELVDSNGDLDPTGTCATGGAQIGAAKPITANGTVVSDAAGLTAVDHYCWRAEFSGDESLGVPPSSDSSAGECFDVTPVDPTIPTEATVAAEVNTEITDTAELDGTAETPGTNGVGPSGSIDATDRSPAGGTITFSLYGPADTTCEADAIYTKDVTVSGDGTYGGAADGVGYTPTEPGIYRWIASYSGNSPNTNAVSGACNDANEATAVVDARISIGESASNEVGDPHTFTILVEQNDGTGWTTAPDGTAVTVTLTETNGAVVDLDANTCADPGTVDGECSVTFTSDTAGKITGHASVTFNVAGVSLTRATDGEDGNSGDATKFFVDAQIDLSPLTATNEVNDAHEITATVQQDDGRAALDPLGDGVSGWAPAPIGTTVDFSLLNNTAGATFVGDVDSCTTETAAGTCSVSINTSSAGSVDIHATTTFSVGGVSLTRATGTGGNNSADANKVYVDAYITIGPEEETNTVGDPHTFVINVFQDDGRAAADPAGDGVDGVGPAPDGTPVTVELTDSDGAANEVSEDTCADPGTDAGECTVTFTSPTAGTVTGHASVTFLVGGESLSRNTDGIAPNSGDAIKHFVAGSIAWAKEYADALQGGATFELCRTNDYILPDGGIDPTPLDPPVCVEVVDDIGDAGYVGNDEDPDAGEFLVSGLPLGRYTVNETAAPEGFELDESEKTADLVPGDTEADLTGDPFINSRPVLKITGFGYTNAPDGDQPFGILAGTSTYSVTLHNYGTADALLTNSSLVVSDNATCVGGNTLDLSGETVLVGMDSTEYTLVCSYDDPDPAEISATLTVNYTTNGLERSASGSPATITFTVAAD